MLFERLPCDSAPSNPFRDALIQCVRGRQAARSPATTKPSSDSLGQSWLCGAENFARNGTCDFCFDNKVHFRCEFCCNYPLEIRATSFNERRSNRSFTSAGQELANFGRRRSRRHVESIGPPARSFRSRDFIGQWRAERAGDGRVEGVRCCLERHWPARRERLRGDRSGQTKTTSQRSCPYRI